MCVMGDCIMIERMEMFIKYRIVLKKEINKVNENF